MDDLLKYFGYWLLDDPYGLSKDRLFACPSVAPLSRGRPKGCGSLMHVFMILIIFFFCAICRDLVGWPIVSIPFFKETVICHFLDGSRRFTNLTSGPYK